MVFIFFRKRFIISLWLWESILKFSELVRLLDAHGFRLVKEKGSIRYYIALIGAWGSRKARLLRRSKQ